MQILHQIDVGGDLDPTLALRSYFAHLSTDGGPAADDDEAVEGPPADVRIDRPLVEELVKGVSSHRGEIDDLLTEASRNWRLERMALVERNVIRIALYELRYCPTVPVNVVLNEAIELSKTYGTAEGTAFVNGLLERAVTDLQVRK